MTTQPTDRVALITIAHGRHTHLRAQVQRLGVGTRRPDRHVVVAMGDAQIAGLLADQPDTDVIQLDADPAALPLAAARNIGAGAALAGGAESLIFLDVDCLPGDHLVQRYAAVTRRRTGKPQLWCGPVHYLPALQAGQSAYDDRDLAASRPHPARPAPAADQTIDEPRLELFWSLSFSMTAGHWREIGGFCENYVGYGAEDTDFARSVGAVGGGMTWVGGAVAYHQYHPTSSPPVQHLDDILRNAELFARRWGDYPMLGWLRQFESMGLVQRDPQTGTWARASKES